MVRLRTFVAFAGVAMLVVAMLLAFWRESPSARKLEHAEERPQRASAAAPQLRPPRPVLPLGTTQSTVPAALAASGSSAEFVESRRLAVGEWQQDVTGALLECTATAPGPSRHVLLAVEFAHSVELSLEELQVYVVQQVAVREMPREGEQAVPLPPEAESCAGLLRGRLLHIEAPRHEVTPATATFEELIAMSVP